jgi:hypothetical protein
MPENFGSLDLLISFNAVGKEVPGSQGYQHNSSALVEVYDWKMAGKKECTLKLATNGSVSGIAKLDTKCGLQPQRL